MRTLFCLIPQKYVHLEFHMESLGIPSEMQINSIEWHIWWVSAPQSIRTRTESLKIRNKYSGSTFLQRYLHLEFHLESHIATDTGEFKVELEHRTFDSSLQ